MNGQNIYLKDDYIGPNYTAVTINNITYVLYQNMPKTLVGLTTNASVQPR